VQSRTPVSSRSQRPLPPEIRNRIYGFLFEREEPVLLHDGKSYRRHLLEGLQDNIKLSDIFDDNPNAEIDIEQHVKDNEFKHCFGECIGLLQSCRQVYHEAVGILYSRNTFLFSPVLDQEDSDEYDQTKSAAAWMISIGSHFRLLSQVQIDVDAVCPHLCYGNEYHFSFDLLPLLRIIWANSDAKCEITFVHTARFLDSSIHSSHRHVATAGDFPPVS
jgi:hypothetical protein